MHMANQLIKTGLALRCVSGERPRNSHLPNVRLRVQVWKALIDADSARIWKLGSRIYGKVTRYRATGKLLGLRKQWRLRALENLCLERSTEMLDPSRYSLVLLYGNKFDPPPENRRAIPSRCESISN